MNTKNEKSQATQGAPGSVYPAQTMVHYGPVPVGTMQWEGANQAPTGEVPEGTTNEPEGSEKTSRKRRRDVSVGPWDFTPETDVTHESGCGTCEEYRAHRGRAASRRDRDFEAAEAQREMWRTAAHPYEFGYQQGRAAGSADVELARVRLEHQVRLTREAEEREVAARRALQTAERRADEMERELARVRVELSVKKETPGSTTSAAPQPTSWARAQENRPMAHTGPEEPPKGQQSKGKVAETPKYSSVYEEFEALDDAEDDVTPPEIMALQYDMAEAWNNPGGEMEKSIHLKMQEAKKLAPHMRTEAQTWMLNTWQPRSLKKDWERERRIQRRREDRDREIAQGRQRLESQPGPSIAEAFGGRGTGFVPRGRGMNRGRGRGETPRGAATGRMPQPTPYEPHEVQMRYYTQHPQGLPSWILERYAAVPKTERLTAEELGALRAYLFLRRISPLTTAERQPFMRGAEQLLSQVGTYEEWRMMMTAANVPNVEEEREMNWAGLPTTTLDEAAVRAHIARQGITRERFQALHTWATWSRASRNVPAQGGTGTTQQTDPRGDVTASSRMDEDP
jgi:hypothetical protein